MCILTRRVALKGKPRLLDSLHHQTDRTQNDTENATIQEPGHQIEWVKSLDRGFSGSNFGDKFRVIHYK